MNIIHDSYDKFCKSRFPLPTETQVGALEQRLSVLLPNDYRQYLLKYNGGLFSEPEITPPTDECPLDCLTFMRGIQATHATAELGRQIDLSLFSGNDPLQLLPIGYTAMGNLIVLIIRGNESGYIGLEAIGQGTFLLAKGVEGFFRLLRERSPE